MDKEKVVDEIKEMTFEDIILKSSLYNPIDFEKIDINNVKEYKKSEEYETFHNVSVTSSIWTRGQGGPVTDLRGENIASFFDFLISPESTTVDCYCKHCEKEKTFLSVDKKNNENESGCEYFNLVFICTTCRKENLYFSFKREGYELIKIGEYPSKYSLGKNNIGKYRSILGEEKFDEYNKAVIVDSLGFSIGGFTYLRRIFENFLFDIFEENEEEIGISLEDFKKELKENQFKLLRDYLPDWVNDNKTEIYGILSIHIHSLTEESAKEFFPLMKETVDVILEKRLEDITKEKKADDVQKKISKAHSMLKKMK